MENKYQTDFPSVLPCFPHHHHDFQQGHLAPLTRHLAVFAPKRGWDLQWDNRGAVGIMIWLHRDHAGGEPLKTEVDGQQQASWIIVKTSGEVQEIEQALLGVWKSQ